MKRIKLSVEIVSEVEEPFIRYEWFGLKKRRRYVDLDEKLNEKD